MGRPSSWSKLMPMFARKAFMACSVYMKDLSDNNMQEQLLWLLLSSSTAMQLFACCIFCCCR
jgi:hypothetical protein